MRRRDWSFTYCESIPNISDPESGVDVHSTVEWYGCGSRARRHGQTHKLNPFLPDN